MSLYTSDILLPEITQGSRGCCWRCNCYWVRIPRQERGNEEMRSTDIRRLALKAKITMATTFHCGLAMVKAMAHNPFKQIISLQELGEGKLPN